MTEYLETQEPDGSIRRVPATRWRNPTGSPMRVVVIAAEARPRASEQTDRAADGRPWAPQHRITYVIPGGGECLIPREHDNAVQQIRDNRVVGGLAPNAIRMSQGEPPAKIHPALVERAPTRSARGP